MNNKKIYSTPSIEAIMLQSEDIMSLSLNDTNEGTTEDKININDLF